MMVITRKKRKEKYYTLRESAEVLGITAKTAYTRLKSVPGIKYQKGFTLIPKKAVHDYKDFWDGIRKRYYTGKEAIAKLKTYGTKLARLSEGGEIRHEIALQTGPKKARRFYLKDEIDKLALQPEYLAENYYTVAEASKIMETSEAWIRKFCRRGIIQEYCKVDRRIYLTKKAVDAFRFLEDLDEKDYIKVEDATAEIGCSIRVLQKAWVNQIIRAPLKVKGEQFLLRKEVNAFGQAYKSVDKTCFNRQEVSSILRTHLKGSAKKFIDENLTIYVVKNKVRYYLKKDVFLILQKLLGV